MKNSCQTMCKTKRALAETLLGPWKRSSAIWVIHGQTSATLRQTFKTVYRDQPPTHPNETTPAMNKDGKEPKSTCSGLIILCSASDAFETVAKAIVMMNAVSMSNFHAIVGYWWSLHGVIPNGRALCRTGLQRSHNMLCVLSKSWDWWWAQGANRAGFSRAGNNAAQ